MFQPKRYTDNVIAYHGPIGINLVSFMSNYIKITLNAESQIIHKLYKVFIELVQNISYYSAESHNDMQGMGTGIGWFTITEQNGSFTLTTGNLIKKEHEETLIRNCTEINKLTEAELRQLKRNTRGLADVKDIGAHIGLIHTSLISGNKIIPQITEVNDTESFFTLTVVIDK